MSEIGEMYKALRQNEQASRELQRVENLRNHTSTDWIQHTPYHWGRWVDGKKLDFWPSRDKWMYDGKVRVGGLADWLKERGEAP